MARILWFSSKGRRFKSGRPHQKFRGRLLVARHPDFHSENESSILSVPTKVFGFETLTTMYAALTRENRV